LITQSNDKISQKNEENAQSILSSETQILQLVRQINIWMNKVAAREEEKLTFQNDRFKLIEEKQMKGIKVGESIGKTTNEILSN
jgi:hypothetical protein